LAAAIAEALPGRARTRIGPAGAAVVVRDATLGVDDRLGGGEPVIPLAAINQLAAACRGRGRNEAYLEFAQEHFLDWLRLEGLFEDDAVVFRS
jgi:hypothetical protein